MSTVSPFQSLASAVGAAASAATGADKGTIVPAQVVQWPELTTLQTWEIIGIPSFITVLFITILYFWKPFGDDLRDDPDEKTHLLEPGIQAEEDNYSEAWTKTFDLAFTVMMAGGYIALLVSTWRFYPELFNNSTFWLYQIPKPVVMMSVSLCTGMICLYYIQTDDRGYIVGKSKKRTDYSQIFRGSRGMTCCGFPVPKPWFKVNYTRKVQHFAAYLIPLVIKSPASCNCDGLIPTAWGQILTLTCFWVLIKPIRERIGCIMVQFNSMDRPEDRPYTLKWIVGGNILPGTILILIFRHLLQQTNQENLALIFVFVTGLGDGFAEPIGVYFGRHKYKTSSCTDDRKYVRSFEGSACVWLSGYWFTALMWYGFKNSTQFWVCFWLMGPIMSVAEATSPHTLDTPALMTLGGLIIYGCVTFL